MDAIKWITEDFDVTIQEKKEWMLRESHHTGVRSVLRALQCMDDSGQIRAWKPTTWEELDKSGHSSLDFDKCRCKLA